MAPSRFWNWFFPTETPSKSSPNSPKDRKSDSPGQPTSEVLDCRSPEGVTVGIIDSINVLCGFLNERDDIYSSRHVLDAMMDLNDSPGFRKLKAASQVAKRLADARDDGIPTGVPGTKWFVLNS
jgi:hypothetical protein